GQRLRVAVDPEDLRPPLTRRVERRRTRVDSGRLGPELGERGRRLARPGQHMEDALAGQVAERALDEERKLDRLRAGLVSGVPGAEVLLGRLHPAAQAPSE